MTTALNQHKEIEQKYHIILSKYERINILYKRIEESKKILRIIKMK
jgi:hypothetical protein